MSIIPVSPPRRVMTRTGARRESLARENTRLRREVSVLRFAATHDRLTGLLNRAGLIQAWPVPDATGLLLLDLNHFKPVNDRFGHLAGDLVLATVSARLMPLVTVAARLAGDEFVLVTTDPDPTGVASLVSEAVAVPITLPHGVTVSVSAAVGVHRFEVPIDVIDAIAAADHAMYAAKRAAHARAAGTAARPVPAPIVSA